MSAEYKLDSHRHLIRLRIICCIFLSRLQSVIFDFKRCTGANTSKDLCFAKRVWEGPPSCSKVQFDCLNRLSVQICTKWHVDLCNLTYASLLKVHLDFSQKSHLYRKYVGQICSKEVVTKKLQKKCHFQIVPSPSQLDSLEGTKYYAHAYKLCALLCAV